MNTKTIVIWACIAGVIFFLIQDPHGSARLIMSVGHLLRTAADGLSLFISREM